MKKKPFFDRYYLKLKQKLRMKLTILTLCLCVLQVSASVTTIGQNFNLQIKNQALKEVLKEIESKTNYRFFYNDFIMDGSKQVTVNLSNKNIEQVMDELLNGSEVSYKILNNNLIVIAPALELQQNKVTGTILDKTGQPLPGVSILEKGTTNGTVSDVNGKYSLTVQNPNATLVFSFIGYNTEERPVASQSTIDVSMVENITQFDEIVVVGYGTQRQLTLTGSISKLSSEKLQNKPVSSIESALQGQVAGVSVVNTGAPGVSPTVRIRGVGSVNYSADPLYVIDGVAVGNLNNFDVRDMESVSILKDASAAAIYGSRAANGVVLITTKKGGRDGKMKLSIDASTGTQAAWKKLDLLKRDDYIKFGTTLLTNAGLSLPARWSKMNDPIYEGATQTYAQTETDWQDEMFRSAQISQLNVNLSGGTEKLRLYTSYGRFSQDGTMLGTDYNRHSFRINTDADLGKYFTIGEKVKASYSKTSNEKVSGGRTQLKHMLNQIPYIPVHDPTKTGGYRSADGSDGADPENPVRIALMDKSHTYVVNLVGNAFVDVKFTDWLKYRSSVGVEYSWTRKFIDNPIYNDGYNSRTDHYLEDDRNTYLSQVYTNQLTFDHTFEKHYVSAVIVAEKQTTSNTYLNGNGKNTTNDISELSGSSSQVLDGYLQETALLSYAGRLNYSYADKYLMSASMRRDGSSNLAPGHKWGNFPGASLGWVISKENFMKDMQAISNLKLRASYGTLGFNNLGAYPWQAVVYTNTTAVFNNDATYTGAYSTTKENKDLQWEITKMTNGGFDLALLDNSITFSAEYYIRKVDNLIVDNPMPPSMGLTDNPVANVGAMKNWGYDFTVGYSKQKGEFKYSVNANISFIKNEVTKLSANSPSIEKSGGTSDYGGYTITRTEGGHSIQGFYGWVTDGIFQKQTDIDNLNAKAPSGIYQTSSTKPGDIKFKDLNQDNVIDDKDKTYIGNFMPDFNYNINLTAEYKGFDVSLFFQGVQGNDIYNGTKVLTQGMARLFNQDKAVLNAWDGSDATKNTNIPRAISGDPNHNTRTSNRFVEDGSYLRLKNLTIGYNVPRLMLSKVFGGAFSGCRVYITGQNLLTFTKYTGYDPEVGSSSDYSGSSSARLLQGVDFGFSPQPRTFLFGINASF
jgi:TonB-linked SusC/RagA family outer membrane protein